jgi:hypothetical protein
VGAEAGSPEHQNIAGVCGCRGGANKCAGLRDEAAIQLRGHGLIFGPQEEGRGLGRDVDGDGKGCTVRLWKSRVEHLTATRWSTVAEVPVTREILAVVITRPQSTGAGN